MVVHVVCGVMRVIRRANLLPVCSAKQYQGTATRLQGACYRISKPDLRLAG
jgi:hypothetical protein